MGKLSLLPPLQNERGLLAYLKENFNRIVDAFSHLDSSTARVPVSHLDLTDVTSDEHHPKLHHTHHEVGGDDVVSIPVRRTGYPFTFPNILSVQAGKGHLRIPYNHTIVSAWIEVDVAPVGASILVDINKNGGTIFTNQVHRPTITTGNKEGSASAIDVPNGVAGDVYTPDLDQVGLAGTEGAWLVLVMEVEEI